MRTSKEWWNETKNSPTKLNHWLKRQYVGEMAAVNLLSEVLLQYGYDATEVEWNTVHKIMQQEAIHARWMKQLMDARGVKPEANASAERRYWAAVKPAVTNFAEAMAAGHHAENMRLERIRAICEDDEAPPDIRAVFLKILPHEEWHEEAFGEMAKGRTLTRYHEAGLEALNLTLQ